MGYKSWRKERAGSDKGGGGLNMLYRESLSAHEWNPVVPPNLHFVQNGRQWLLLNCGKQRCAFLHVYIACDTHKDDSFLHWNENLFYLVTQEALKLKRQGFTVMAMGDFNSRVGTIPGLEFNVPSTNRNTPMFMNFLSEVSLMIMNTLPITRGTFTRFMDSSGRPGSRSLLDYGLIDCDQSHTVTSFVIDESARFDCGSDHALLECQVVFDAVPRVVWSYQEAIQYNLHGASDFSGFQSLLDEYSSSVSLSQFEQLPTEQMLPHITESLNKSATKCFGLKLKRKRSSRRLPRQLVELIKAKNNIVKTLATVSGSLPSNELEKMKSQLDSLKAEIRDGKADFILQRKHRLRSRLLLADPTRKKFWRFLKSQCKAAGSISALKNKDEIMVFDQDNIEEAVLDHFAKIFQGKRHPVFVDKTPVDQVSIALQEIEDILQLESKSFESNKFENDICPPFTFTELNDVLEKLPNGKASGYDRVPNELLRNSSFDFKQYLLLFYNKIIADGAVPELLNHGKCMLVYKVYNIFPDY